MRRKMMKEESIGADEAFQIRLFKSGCEEDGPLRIDHSN
jgi:hypothetical protein